MEQRDGDAAPRIPDGPPPAREQLPLPRRRRQAHLEPQLRTPGGAGTGTPFAAFAAGGSPTPPPPPQSPGPAQRAGRGERAARPDHAAAFHVGTRRGRGTMRAWDATASRLEQGPPPVRPAEWPTDR